MVVSPPRLQVGCKVEGFSLALGIFLPFYFGAFTLRVASSRYALTGQLSFIIQCLDVGQNSLLLPLDTIL